jgi:hypothetical protein
MTGLENLNSKKFILTILSLLFLMGIFVYMAIMKYHTASTCTEFLPYLALIIGTYSGANIAQQYIDKKTDKNNIVTVNKNDGQIAGQIRG